MKIAAILLAQTAANRLNHPMVLELPPLANALARLKEGLEALARNPENTLLRDGVIQRFEFTYELAHKTLKRALETASASPEQYDHMAFADLIRSGNEQGLLLGDWPVWKKYRDLRAKTSHTYKESAALEVLAGIGGFVRDVEFLCGQVQARMP
jgi:nucleotidyltransferase substrate binding protein (TIGR01987 family)